MSQSSIRAVPGFMSKWVPFTIALTSFVVSMYTFFITQREPIVDVVLPQQIRISVNSSGPEPFSIAFLRPTFVHAGPSQQVEVIETMRLSLTPPGETQAHTIEWRETGNFVQDATSPAINYQWVGDPAPLLLSRETAQSPLAVFYGDPNLMWAAGEWSGELRGTRAAGGPDLVATFNFSISQELFELLRTGGGTYVSLPITPSR